MDVAPMKVRQAKVIKIIHKVVKYRVFGKM